MNRDEPVELAIVARRAGVRIALVRRYLEFGLFEPQPEPSERPPERSHPRPEPSHPRPAPSHSRPEPSHPHPRPEPSEPPRYDPRSAARVAQAERLRRDLGLNFAGAVLVCELLDRIRELEARE